MSLKHSNDGLWKVTEKIEGAHAIHDWYPLLPGDVLGHGPNGTWNKLTGLGICEFTLTAEQEAALEPVSGMIVIDGSLA